MLRDPIELYEYPKEWCNETAEALVKSGLFILKKDGYLRRGITTATTVSTAIVAAIASLKHDFEVVSVSTPLGIDVKVEVDAENGFAIATKFAGDHEFDVTNGIEVHAKAIGKGIVFGEGIGEINGKKAVSESAMRQILENFSRVCKLTDYKGGVLVEIPDGKRVAKETKNEELGIKGGISILGTTGFVEPWCRELVALKVEIAKRYAKIAITTGRRAWEYAKKKYPDFQPFVFGIHLDEILSEHGGEKIIVGYRGLLKRWAGNENLFEKAKRFGAEVDVIAEDYWGRNL
ncbi:MAG: cobalt-precorrin-5B (C(1))-methyltransferase [Archaeoglobaceae archaeon]|uniref:Cobalt-precorrin-5B (C(1))-methyltransferase n=1 Tax=Archaeoglobus fulgidus TaxID=2234 RepID=A0A7J3M1E4_ARCFL